MAPAEAPGAASVCAAFAEHFFIGSDEAVQQYVIQSLLTAAEEGEDLPQQAAALRDFLPPSCTPQALLAGLHELERALHQPPGQQQAGAFAWLQSEQQGQQGQPGCTPKSSDSLAECLPTPQAAGGAGEQQPLAPTGGSGPAPSSSSSLSVTAAEFRPGAAAASLAASLVSLQLGGGGASNSSSSAADGWGKAEHSAAVWWEEEGGTSGQQTADPGDGWWGTHEDSGEQQYAQPPAGQWAAAAAAAEAQAAAGGGLAARAFLAVLADQFPLWSTEALQQLFEEQRGDFGATVQTLCSLESELEGQQQAGGGWAPGGPAGDATNDGSSAAAGPSFSEEDFPSLGPSSSSGPHPASRGRDAGARYASAARAAAELPAEPVRRGASTRPVRRAAGATAAAAQQQQSRAAAVAAGLGPAPIWQQQEGVARYATGKALAAEYAALRADATDHARLRNAYFQQATQAYQAGDRRLAKELGARGRWHNEQMHAAHQAASSQLFAQRNTGTLSTGGGRGDGGNGSGASTAGVSRGGVPTVDLHGLHVSEALDRLDVLLAEMQAAASRGGGGGQRRLRVVVGEGKHGKVPARLPACVRRHLEAQGLAVSEPYAGMLEIRL